MDVGDWAVRAASLHRRITEAGSEVVRMDGRHFDTLTRHLSARLSRRTSLSLLASLGLSDLGAPDHAEAKRKKKRCPPCKTRKKGKCKKNKPDGTACPGGTCQNGGCVLTGCIPSC